MSSLGSLYIKKETLQVLLDTITKKGDKGLELTIGIDDESNDYGQNISCYVSQSKEERDEKKKKFYAGNGRIFWTNGTILKGEKPSDNSSSQHAQASDVDDEDGLPF